MIDNIIGPAAKEVNPRGNVIWQDDLTRIHCVKVSLDAVHRNFTERLDQAPKMADVWPIVNIWAIVKEDVKATGLQNSAELKKRIKESWRRMDKVKDLCKRLITSIPERLKALIKNKGQ